MSTIPAFLGSKGSTSANAWPAIFSYCPTPGHEYPPKVGDSTVVITNLVNRACTTPGTANGIASTTNHGIRFMCPPSDRELPPSEPDPPIPQRVGCSQRVDDLQSSIVPPSRVSQQSPITQHAKALQSQSLRKRGLSLRYREAAACSPAPPVRSSIWLTSETAKDYRCLRRCPCGSRSETLHPRSTWAPACRAGWRPRSRFCGERGGRAGWGGPRGAP